MIMYLTAIKDKRILNVHKIDYKGNCNHLSKYLDKYPMGTSFEFRFAHNSNVMIECPPTMCNVTMHIEDDTIMYPRIGFALDCMIDDYIHLFS